MMIDQLIADAQTFLRVSPYDEAHGLDHHQRVWNNIKWIIKQEKLLVDREALEIAAWWHDVDKGTNNSRKLITALRHHHVPRARIETILTIIYQHSFEDTQTTIEGKILFDADKLEYVSLDRWKKFLTMLQKNPSKQDTMKAYQNAIANRIIPVYQRLYFSATKQLFANDLLQFSKWYNSQFQILLPPLPAQSS